MLIEDERMYGSANTKRWPVVTTGPWERRVDRGVCQTGDPAPAPPPARYWWPTDPRPAA